jgi:hypothetical protein
VTHEEAVEAAAQALFARAGYTAGWDDLNGADAEQIRETYRARARTALSAGAPLVAA